MKERRNNQIADKYIKTEIEKWLKGEDESGSWGWRVWDEKVGVSKCYDWFINDNSVFWFNFYLLHNKQKGKMKSIAEKEEECDENKMLRK